MRPVTFLSRMNVVVKKGPNMYKFLHTALNDTILKVIFIFYPFKLLDTLKEGFLCKNFIKQKQRKLQMFDVSLDKRFPRRMFIFFFKLWRFKTFCS